jgi:hypothetical protein
MVVFLLRQSGRVTANVSAGGMGTGKTGTEKVGMENGESGANGGGLYGLLCGKGLFRVEVSLWKESRYAGLLVIGTVMLSVGGNFLSAIGLEVYGVGGAGVSGGGVVTWARGWRSFRAWG